jgi:hypothetical protein
VLHRAINPKAGITLSMFSMSKGFVRHLGPD